MKKLLSVLAVLFAASLVPMFSGCDEADDLIDCVDLCESVEDCAGDEFDVSECVDSCEDQPSNEIERCDDCLDEQDDTDICTPCTAECAPLAI